MELALIAAAGLASGWMLLWAAAAAIPLVLHFLYRRRQNTVPWAAMQLLQQVVEKESRRVRIEQLLLLLVRTLILLILAVVLARPFWNDSDRSEAAEPAVPATTWIFAIDTSYSMNYRAASQTRLQTAQQRATEIVETANEGDSFLLVSLGQPVRALIAQPTFDRQSLFAALARLTINDAGCDVSGGLQLLADLAKNAVREASIGRKVRIVLLTDLGNNHWQTVTSGVDAQRLRNLADEYQLEVEPMVETTTANQAIMAIQPSALRAILGEPLEVDVTVANFSSSMVQRMPVQLSIDDQIVASEYLNLEPSATGIARLSVTPGTIGASVLTATIPPDRLVTDNRRSQTIQIQDDYDMLFVEQESGDSRVLQLALRPKRALRRTRRLTAVPTIELSAIDLSLWQVIVLNDLANLEQNMLGRLRAFVENGGALVCLMGPRSSPALWNAHGSELLGFQLLEPSSQGDWSIDPLEYRSPVVAPFAGFPDAGLVTTPVFQFWKIEPEASQQAKWTVDAAVTTGQPIIVRHRVGEGSVASILSAPQSGSMGHNSQSQAWNAMTTWPSFVPLMQTLLQVTLDAGVENHTVLAGQPLFGKTPGPIPSATSGDRSNQLITITRPDGTNSQLVAEDMDADGNASWIFTQTQQSGVYFAQDSQGREKPLVVNVDPTESSLSSLDPALLPRSLPRSPATAFQTAIALQDDISPQLTRSLLAGLGLLLLTESLLAWYLGRRIG